jgi:hypothetical protein
MTETQEITTNLQLKIKNKTEDLKRLEQQVAALRSEIQADIATIEKIIIDAKEHVQS